MDSLKDEKNPGGELKVINFIQRHRSQLGIIGLLIGLWIIFIITSPKVFLNPHAYGSIMRVVPITIILATALVFLVACREIDLSFSSIMGLSAWTFVSLFDRVHPIFAILAGLVVGAAAGCINGILVTKVGLPSLVTTLGMMFFWRGFIMIGTQGLGKAITEVKETPLYTIFVGKVGAFTTVHMFWAIAITFVFWIVLNRRKFGAYILYVGDNIESARMMGINIDLVKIGAFALVGGAAAFAGLISVLQNLVFFPVAGEGYLLVALAAVFLGGTPTWGGVGTVFGSFVAPLILGLIDTGLIAAGITGFWTQFIYGLVIVLSLTAHRVLRR